MSIIGQEPRVLSLGCYKVDVALQLKQDVFELERFSQFAMVGVNVLSCVRQRHGMDEWRLWNDCEKVRSQSG